jgi:hypothetical protein
LPAAALRIAAEAFWASGFKKHLLACWRAELWALAANSLWQKQQIQHLVGDNFNEHSFLCSFRCSSTLNSWLQQAWQGNVTQRITATTPKVVRNRKSLANVINSRYEKLCSMQWKTDSTVVRGATNHGGILQHTYELYVCTNVVVAVYVEEEGHHHGCTAKERRYNHGFIAKERLRWLSMYAVCTRYCPP